MTWLAQLSEICHRYLHQTLIENFFYYGQNRRIPPRTVLVYSASRSRVGERFVTFSLSLCEKNLSVIYTL